MVSEQLNPQYAYNLSDLRKTPRLFLMIYMEKAFGIPRSSASDPQWKGVFSGDLRSAEACVEYIWNTLYEEKGWRKGNRLSSEAPKAPKEGEEEQESEEVEEEPLPKKEKKPQKPKELENEVERKIGPVTLKTRGTGVKLEVPTSSEEEVEEEVEVEVEEEVGEEVEEEESEAVSIEDEEEVEGDEDDFDETSLAKMQQALSMPNEDWNGAGLNDKVDLLLDTLRHLSTAILSTLFRGRLPISEDDVSTSLEKIAGNLMRVEEIVDHVDDLPGSTYSKMWTLPYEESDGTKRMAIFSAPLLLNEKLYPVTRLNQMGVTLGLDLRGQDRVVAANLIVDRMVERQDLEG